MTAQPQESLRSIGQWLMDSPATIGSVVDHARHLRLLTEQLGSQLPAPLAQHCRVGNIDENCLILQVDSPTWATRLRYLAPALLAALRQQPGLEHLYSTRIKVRPAPFSAAPPPASGLRLSEQAAAGIREAARTSPYPALQAALLRLSRHTRPHPG
jgi:hypothetical protein